MSAPRIARHRDFARITIAADTVDAHWLWLRHNCPCCVHKTTGERILDVRHIPRDLQAEDVAVEGAQVAIRWREGGRSHGSRYDWAWLLAHRYGAAADFSGPTLADVEIAGGGGADLGAIMAAALHRVRAHALAVVRDAGLDTERLIGAFEAQGLQVVPTHFGRIEDLRTDNTTNQNTDQLGYTDAPVALHTDQPFIERPPRYQMLHCLQTAAEGGDNYLVDARAIVAFLRATDREALEVLATTKVRFHRKQRQFESIVDRAMLDLDEAGALRQVRHSYFPYAPFSVPFPQMRRFYECYRLFGELVEDPRYHLKVALAPGDLVLYDNFVALHARTGFRGARWMRGVYFDPPG